MIERTNTRPLGLNRQGLRTWAMLFLTLGMAGRSIIQNELLGIGMVSNAELLAAMNDNPNTMGFATLALVCQAVEACAVPIFVFMLVEGFMKTKSWQNYILRVLGMAVLSEIPYNMAVSGKLFDFSSRNPAFGLVLCLIMMYYLQKYAGKSLKNILIKCVLIVASVVWAEMLGIDHGACSVIVACVLYFVWHKKHFRVFIGCSAVMACCMIDPFYLGAPMSFLAIHFYNEEEGDGNIWVNYLCYPAMLLALGLVCNYL